MTDIVPHLGNGGGKAEFLTQYEVELYLKQNAEFARQFVFTYLKTNLEFADEFFQKWYDNLIGMTRLHRKSRKRVGDRTDYHKHPRDLDPNFMNSLYDDCQVFEDDCCDGNEEEILDNSAKITYNDTNLPNMTNLDTYIDGPNSNRRRSDPASSEAIEKLIRCGSNEKGLDTIDENTVSTRSSRSNSLVLPQESSRYRTVSIDENSNLKEAIELLRLPATDPQQTGKPHLRKAQSAPTYKKNLSNLIRSSVYSGSGLSKHINVENHAVLRETNESHCLVEIIKDIAKDMSLTKVCFKILVNLGFMLNVEKAAIYLVHTVNDQKVLKLLLNDVSIAKGIRKESLSSSVSKRPQLIPMGSGIVGHVAETGESVIANDVSTVNLYAFFKSEIEILGIILL